MADDLTTRCLAEVERAMAASHDQDCPAAYSDWAPPGRCTCLASRLARMLAAGMEHAYKYGVMNSGDPITALCAVAQAREAPNA